jgi:hypothetical protein
MTSRRDVMRALGIAGLPVGGRPYRAAITTNGPARDVRAFGAKGDGVTDDTAAFNAATGAGEAWHDGLRCAITVPPGSYRIDGTVFVRRGQDFMGAGDATVIDASRARDRTLVLGGSARGTDPGGAPANIARLHFLGGSGKAPLIQAALQGFTIRDLFISAAGTAIEVNGADGIVSGVIIDQALNGLILRGARNVLVDGVVSYLVNYAVTIDSDTNDVALSNLILGYSRHASVLFAEGATGITSIRIAGATFVSSIQYPTFVGHVHARAAPFDAQFTDCVFRNWREHAVVQGAGRGADLSFSNCTFDAARSHPSYNASATAKGLRTGVDGRFLLNNCRFRNLAGEVVLIGPGLSELTMNHGTIDDCAGDPLRLAAAPAGRVRIRAVGGFGRRIDTAGASGIVLPWLGTSTAWRISATRRSSPGGLTAATVVVTEARGTAFCAMGEISSYGTAPQLGAGFGSAPKGPDHAPFGNGSGLLCVSAPTPDLDWSAESLG